MFEKEVGMFVLLFGIDTALANLGVGNPSMYVEGEDDELMTCDEFSNAVQPALNYLNGTRYL